MVSIEAFWATHSSYQETMKGPSQELRSPSGFGRQLYPDHNAIWDIRVPSSPVRFSSFVNDGSKGDHDRASCALKRKKLAHDRTEFWALGLEKINSVVSM